MYLEVNRVVYTKIANTVQIRWKDDRTKKYRSLEVRSTVKRSVLE